ncbi:hypothetical protein ACFQX4_16440 [Roseomonas sp. GCM10028921]
MLELEVDPPEGTGLRVLMLRLEDNLIARLDFMKVQRLPAVRAGDRHKGYYPVVSGGH